MARQTTFHNLIDYIITLEEDPEFHGRPGEIFRTVIAEYFFKRESSEKTMKNLFNDLQVPDFAASLDSMLSIDLPRLEEWVNGNSINDSLSGKIMFSKACFKTFYSNFPPEFKKFPGDVQAQMIQEVKDRNQGIIQAFRKMKADHAADRKRTVMHMAALAVSNVHRKTGTPLTKLEGDAAKIIAGIFPRADEVFKGNPHQMTSLTNDGHVKELIKAFFVVRKFQDIASLAEHFRTEIRRYEKRAIRAHSGT